MGEHVVARIDEIGPGERKIVEVDGREVGIFNVDGEFVAFLHRCPHMGGPLCHGDVIGLVESAGPGDVRLDEGRKFLTCPLHGWEFDIHTGQSYVDPKRMRARRYPVEVRSGADMEPGPYVAERFDVVVDENYVVLVTGRREKRQRNEPRHSKRGEKT